MLRKLSLSTPFLYQFGRFLITFEPRIGSAISAIEYWPQTSRALILTVAAIVLTACATVEPLPSSRIEQAQDKEELKAVFEELQVRAGSGAPEGSQLAKQIETVGSRLANLHASEVRSSLDAARTDQGFVPTSEIDRLLPLPASLSRWSETLAAELQAQINRERSKTADRLKHLTQGLRSMPDDAYAEKIQHLEEVQGLSDNQRYKAQLESLKSRLLEKANTALGEQKTDEAEKILDALETQAPELVGLAELRLQLKRQQIGSRIREDINNDNFERAFTHFKNTSEDVQSPEWVLDLNPSLEKLWNRFQEQLTNATGHRDLAAGYAALERLSLLNKRTNGAFGEIGRGSTDFAEGVYRLSQEARDAGRPSVALGALLVLRQAEPGFPDLQSNIRQTLNLITDEAIPRLSVTKFEGTSQFEQVGGAISAKLSQRLFTQAGDDVRLVERDQLSEVLREQELDMLSRDSEGFSLGAADYLLQGSVLQARVESSKTTGERRERVIVERALEPNPEYNEWQALSSSEKERVPEPPKQIEVPIKEDVTYEVATHRKYGLLNVSYRVIDTLSASFLHTDTTSVEKEIVDQSSQGVKIGEFEVPFSVAQLPSDAQLMTSLVDEVTRKISDQLEKIFDNPKARYIEAAQKHEASGDFEAAAKAAASAYALSEMQGRSDPEVTEALKSYALRSM